ncbi:MAG TPA: response regulator [Candidatus Krumholzibacteria bacterium]|jgi:DNA-binding response OmpR family regulator|nr:response regulator [Candidatus Krumholzibacteria bacterium]
MQKRILIVDDEEPLATILTYALRNEGYQVDWVNDGMKALSYLGVNRPDLIVMDIMMPNLNGLETMRITRQNELMEGVAILALSAKRLTERETRELENLCDAYIPKPFGVETFLGTVSQLLHSTV